MLELMNLKINELFCMNREGYFLKVLSLENNPNIVYKLCDGLNGTKARMIVRNNNIEKNGFLVCSKDLLIEFDGKTILFRSEKTRKVIYKLTTPYLETGSGKICNDVGYMVTSIDDSKAIVNICWKTYQKNKIESALPITIHWQIKIEELTEISTYSRVGGELIETPYHTVGFFNNQESEMLLQMKIPTINANDVIERAELVFTCDSVYSADRNVYNISLYRIGSSLSTGYEQLVDSIPLIYPWSLAYGGIPKCSFDITKLLKTRNTEGMSEMFFKIKLDCKEKGYENYVVLHGSTANVDLTPKIGVYLKQENKTNCVQKGDLVSLKKGSSYVTGHLVPQWFQIQKWFVNDVNDEGVLLRYNEFGSRFEMPRINVEDIIFVTRDSVLSSYLEDCK